MISSFSGYNFGVLLFLKALVRWSNQHLRPEFKLPLRVVLDSRGSSVIHHIGTRTMHHRLNGRKNWRFSSGFFSSLYFSGVIKGIISWRKREGERDIDNGSERVGQLQAIILWWLISQLMPPHVKEFGNGVASSLFYHCNIKRLRAFLVLYSKNLKQSTTFRIICPRNSTPDLLISGRSNRYGRVCIIGLDYAFCNSWLQLFLATVARLCRAKKHIGTAYWSLFFKIFTHPCTNLDWRFLTSIIRQNRFISCHIEVSVDYKNVNIKVGVIRLQCVWLVFSFVFLGFFFSYIFGVWFETV